MYLHLGEAAGRRDWRVLPREHRPSHVVRYLARRFGSPIASAASRPARARPRACSAWVRWPACPRASGWPGNAGLPLVLQLPDVEKLAAASAKARRRARVVRAKGGRRESDFVRLIRSAPPPQAGDLPTLSEEPPPHYRSIELSGRALPNARRGSRGPPRFLRVVRRCCPREVGCRLRLCDSLLAMGEGRRPLLPRALLFRVLTLPLGLVRRGLGRGHARTRNWSRRWNNPPPASIAVEALSTSTTMISMLHSLDAGTADSGSSWGRAPLRSSVAAFWGGWAARAGTRTPASSVNASKTHPTRLNIGRPPRTDRESLRSAAPLFYVENPSPVKVFCSPERWNRCFSIDKRMRK